MTANVTPPTSNLLVDAGYLLWAPLGTALPANTVTGSVFVDPWPIAWIPLGQTAAGSKIEDNATVSELECAESYYPIDVRTTKRAPQVTFELLNFTASNLAKALNGASTTVTGATTTTLTQVDAPNPQTETACMLGYESLDGTVRWVGRAVRNSGNLSVQLNKAPNMAAIGWTGMVVKTGTLPAYSWFLAGTARG